MITGKDNSWMFCPAKSFAWQFVGVFLMALLLSPLAQAEIVLRDEGDRGIVLSNPLSPALDFAVAENPLSSVDSIPFAAKVSAAVAARQERKKKLAPLISAAALTHGLPVELLTAMIEVESNFNPRAVSSKGAMGLMQLMPKTARHLAVGDAHDPAANIDGGARYLKELLSRFDNNLHLALAAYNAGPGKVQRNGVLPPYAETRRYVPLVIGRYHSLQSGLLGVK